MHTNISGEEGDLLYEVPESFHIQGISAFIIHLKLLIIKEFLPNS